MNPKHRLSPLRITLLCGVAFLLSAGGPAAPAPPGPVAEKAPPVADAMVRLLPAPSELGGWGLTGIDRVYRGSELYGYMNGGAELFLECGFDRLVVREYAKGEAELGVELYRMTEPAAALAIYLAKCGKEERVEGLSERHAGGRFQLMFVRGAYFVNLINGGGSPGNLPVMADLARRIAARLPRGVPVPAEKILPEKDRVPGSLRLLRGALSLDLFYTLGTGDVLQLKGRATGAAAVYREADGKNRRRLAVVYPAAAQARQALEKLRAGLDETLKAEPSPAGTLSFVDSLGLRGRATVAGKRLEIRLDLPKER
jgi:hypothetical protein